MTVMPGNLSLEPVRVEGGAHRDMCDWVNCWGQLGATTFMHELGHALGLRHGGPDDVNCKPNHLFSDERPVQLRQPGFVHLPNLVLIATRPLDYGRIATALDERSLDEPFGIPKSGLSAAELAELSRWPLFWYRRGGPGGSWDVSAALLHQLADRSTGMATARRY
jgi:hypothetical protein